MGVTRSPGRNIRRRLLWGVGVAIAVFLVFSLRKRWRAGRRERSSASGVDRSDTRRASRLWAMGMLGIVAVGAAVAVAAPGERRLGRLPDLTPIRCRGVPEWVEGLTARTRSELLRFEGLSLFGTDGDVAYVSLGDVFGLQREVYRVSPTAVTAAGEVRLGRNGPFGTWVGTAAGNFSCFRNGKTSVSCHDAEYLFRSLPLSTRRDLYRGASRIEIDLVGLSKGRLLVYRDGRVDGFVLQEGKLEEVVGTGSTSLLLPGGSLNVEVADDRPVEADCF